MEKGLYIIDRDADCIRVRFEQGTQLTSDLIIAAVDEENALFAIKGRYDLWDFRGCLPGPDLGYEAVNRVVDHIENRYGQADGTNKLALLVDNTTQYGLSRMFQTLMDGYPTQIGIFEDETQARLWFGRQLNPEGQTP